MTIAMLFTQECFLCMYASHTACLLTYILSVTCAHNWCQFIPRSKRIPNLGKMPCSLYLAGRPFLFIHTSLTSREA